MSRPTLVSLAKQTGVSRQTVSNVINAPDLVSPETRARVEKAIKESGYKPDAAARALRSARALTLGMRLGPAGDGINGEIMDRFVHHLVAQVQSRGYQVTLFTAESPEAEVAIVLDLQSRRAIDGVILTDTFQGDPRPRLLAEANLPYAAFGRPWDAPEDDQPNPDQVALWADIDGRAGTAIATQHLLDSGHQEIGFIGWPLGSGVGEDRRSGWYETMRRSGVSDLSLARWTCRYDDAPANGAEGMRQLMSRGVMAAVCASDSLALGAVEAYRGRHNRQPNPTGAQLPIVGFDDTPVARVIGLSSVSQPVEAASAFLAAGIIDALSGPAGADRGERNRLIPPVLQVRALADFANQPPLLNAG